MNETLWKKTVALLADMRVETALRLMAQAPSTTTPDAGSFAGSFAGVIETMAHIEAVQRAGIRDPAMLAAFARHFDDPLLPPLFEELPAELVRAALPHALEKPPHRFPEP